MSPIGDRFQLFWQILIARLGAVPVVIAGYNPLAAADWTNIAEVAMMTADYLAFIKVRYWL